MNEPHAQAEPDEVRRRIAELEEAVAADPESDRFVDLARVLVETHQHKRATLVLRAALRGRESHLEGTMLLAEALLARGRQKSATREMARLLSLHPQFVPAMKLLARALIAQSKLAEAQVILQRARTTDPTDAEVVGLQDEVHQLRRGREDTGEIRIREPDGRMVGLAQPPTPPRPAFTGYIKSVTDEEAAEHHGEQHGEQHGGPSARPSARRHSVVARVDDVLDPDETHRVPEADRIAAERAATNARGRGMFGRGQNTLPNPPEEEDDRTRPMSAPPDDMPFFGESLPISRVSDDDPEPAFWTSAQPTEGELGDDAGHADEPPTQEVQRRPAPPAARPRAVETGIVQRPAQARAGRVPAAPAPPRPARRPVPDAHDDSDPGTRPMDAALLSAGALQEATVPIDAPPGPGKPPRPAQPGLLDQAGIVGSAGESATMEATQQLPAVAAAEFDLPATRAFSAPDLQRLLGTPPAAPARPARAAAARPPPVRDDWSGDEPTQALMNADALRELRGMDDPDVLSSTGPVPRMAGGGRAEGGEGPGTVQLPRRKGSRGAQPVSAPPPPRVEIPPLDPEGRRAAVSRPDPARPPAQRPPVPAAPPPARPAATRGPDLDLLSIPLRPDEFDHMPPKPMPVARHAMPADLVDTGSQPAVGDSMLDVARPDRAAAARPPAPDARGPSGPVPPRRAPEPAEAAPRGPVPPPRRAPEPAEAAPRGPVPPPRRAPEPAEAAPRGPVPARRAPEPAEAAPRGPVPPARAAAQPARDPAPPARAPEPPPPTPLFGAELEPHAEEDLTDHLAALVGAELEAVRAAPAAAPTPARARPRRRWLKVVTALLLVVAGTLGLGMVKYRAASKAAETRLAETQQSLADGNYASRLGAPGRLTGAAAEVGRIARLADGVVRLMGKPGLAAHEASVRALLARVLAERVAYFGDRAALADARGAVAEARGESPDAADTAVASALMALAEGKPDGTLQELEAVANGADATPEPSHAVAVVHAAAGRADKAQEYVRRALQIDGDHLRSRTLLAELKAGRGDNSGALQDLELVLDGLAPNHHDARIARERLRIAVNKKPDEALRALENLLKRVDELNLAPAQRARIHDAIGLFHVRRGAIDTARNAYQAAMAAAPDDPRYATGLARLDLAAFKLDTAETVLRSAAAAEPGAAIYRELLARAHLLRGDAGSALRELNAITTATADSKVLEGRAWLELDKLKEAEDAFTAAVRLDAGLRDARILRQLAIFRQGRQESIVLEDLRAQRTMADGGDQRLEDRALPFRAYAEALAQKGQAEAAADEFERALGLDPRDFASRYGLCKLAADARKARDALAQCRKALEINPYYQPAARTAARIGEAHNDAGAVVSALEPLLSRGVSDGRLVRQLARALVELNRPEDALALLKKNKVDTPSARYVEGIVAAAQGHLRRAEELLAPVADQLADDPWAQLDYGDLLVKSGSASKATTWFRRASALTEDPRPTLGLARAALKDGDHNGARQKAKEAERLATTGLTHVRLHAEALSLQGQALLLSGSNSGRSQAERLFEQALRIEPDLPSALLGQGRVAELTRRPDVAVARYFRVSQVAPRDAEAFYRMGALLIEAGNTRARGRADLQRAQALDPEGEWGARAAKLLAP